MKFMVLMIIILIIFIGAIVGWFSLSSYLTNKACNNIGYSEYFVIGMDSYCTNDMVNLYRIRFEGRFPMRAVKINLYNYGEE